MEFHVRNFYVQNWNHSIGMNVWSLPTPAATTSVSPACIQTHIHSANIATVFVFVYITYIIRDGYTHDTILWWGHLLSVCLFRISIKNEINKSKSVEENPGFKTCVCLCVEKRWMGRELVFFGEKLIGISFVATVACLYVVLRLMYFALLSLFCVTCFFFNGLLIFENIVARQRILV